MYLDRGRGKAAIKEGTEVFCELSRSGTVGDPAFRDTVLHKRVPLFVIECSRAVPLRL